jgi:hypothetical protein
MKCENCAHMVSDGGYEYPEYYCEIGVRDDDKHRTNDGCTYTRKQRIAMCKKYNEAEKSCDMMPRLWWDESKGDNTNATR